jgi:hypothetical protein
VLRDDGTVMFYNASKDKKAADGKAQFKLEIVAGFELSTVFRWPLTDAIFAERSSAIGSTKLRSIVFKSKLMKTRKCSSQRRRLPTKRSGLKQFNRRPRNRNQVGGAECWQRTWCDIAADDSKSSSKSPSIASPAVSDAEQGESERSRCTVAALSVAVTAAACQLCKKRKVKARLVYNGKVCVIYLHCLSHPYAMRRCCCAKRAHSRRQAKVR